MLEPREARSTARQGKAIVVGNGRGPDRDGLPEGTLDGARIVIAADGGLRTALALGLRPDCVVGDGDSLRDEDLAALDELRIPFQRVPAEKDESDLELAVRMALAAGVATIVIVGGLDGARVEHSLANVLLLALPDLAGVEASLVDDRSTVRVARANPTSTERRTLAIAGQPGDFVSLFPIVGEVATVTTEGLRYPLQGEPLHIGASRGVSNELVAREATVTVGSGVIVVVHTRRRSIEKELDDGRR